MQTLILNQLHDWTPWRQPWNRLAVHNPMLSYEWLHGWWRHFGEGMQLHLVLFVEGCELRGFLPLYVHTGYLGRELRFLGSGSVCSDYLSAVVDPHSTPSVLHACREYIVDLLQYSEPDNWLRIRMDGMSENDPWLTAIQSTQRLHTKSIGNTWRTALPENWEAFVRQCKGKSVHRKIKKTQERIDTGRIRLRLLDQPSQAEEGLEILHRLHQARRTSLGEAGCFSDERFLPFLREAMAGLIERGLGAYTVIEGEQGPIGTQLLLFSDTTTMMYQSGLDPDSRELEPGHAACYFGFQETMRRGLSTYDFLRGDEAYKAFWGAEAVPMVEATIVAGSLAAQTICGLDRSLRKLKAWTASRFLPVAPAKTSS